MDLLKPFKQVVNKVKDKIDEAKQENEQQAKLDMWKKRLTTAMSEHDTFRTKCAVWDAQYNGTHAIGPNITKESGRVYVSDRDRQKVQDARQVVPLTKQLIESQIDVTVPKPNVEPCEYDDNDPMEQERQRMVEGMLHYMGGNTILERINSENERIAKKNSMAFFKVNYNPNAKSHKWIGAIETTNPHPCNVIPQPGVFRIKDMDYLFHIENRTLDYVCRTYGDKFREELQDEKAEYSQLDDLSEVRTDTAADKNGKLSVVECWYKDKDGDVCLITWCNEVILRDMPKFYYKRGADGKLIEFDEIEMPPIDDGTGNMIPQQAIQVPVHVPKSFPFVIWYNIPREKSYRGNADPEIIHDQQEAIKKVLSIHEEKLIKGTTKVITRKNSGLINKFTDATTQVLETDNPNEDVKVVDLKTPDNSLLEYYSLLVQAAKDALGITEASQGRSENSNLSGEALKTLAANTANRMAVKGFEKNIAYTELYQLYYDFALAFYDDSRPYRSDGDDGKPVYGYWDKSKLVKRDAAGEWYYPEYDIYISADTGLPKDKGFILQTANEAGNRLDNVEFWQVMESIGFPNATVILRREQEKEVAMQQMQQQQAQMMPPDMGGVA